MTRTGGSEAPRTMLSFACELPNLASLAGLSCALLGIYFAILGVFPAAMIGLVWAVVFDWMDGRIARRMPGRTLKQGEFGAHLDSLIDVVSFAVAPAVLLLSVGGFSPWFLPGALLCLAAGTIRLSYFNTFGLIGDSTYRGLALDNNVLILVAIFALQPMLSASGFALVLYVALGVLALLNVSAIPTPKLTGRWYYVLVAYASAASVLNGWRLLSM